MTKSSFQFVARTRRGRRRRPNRVVRFLGCLALSVAMLLFVVTGPIERENR